MEDEIAQGKNFFSRIEICAAQVSPFKDSAETLSIF